MRRKLENGEEKELEGYRMKLFDYSGKNILTISKYDQKLKEEFDRVKKNKNGRTSGWIKTNRPTPSTIYEEDDVSRLRGVGKKTIKKLEVNAGITKVFQLASLGKTDEEVDKNIKELAIESDLTVSLIRNLHSQACSAEHGDPPGEVNHLLEDNPYLSRYGDNWRDKIAKVKSMSKFVCVTELITHIFAETGKAFKGTKHEDTYLVYHDALSQMTDKDSKAWMEKEGLLHRWIRPVLGLNDLIEVEDDDGNVKSSKNYAGRPVGNCPEAMPLDNSLFRDFRTCMDQHVGITSFLPLDDPSRFSKATPKLIMSTVNRLWDPVTGVSPRPSRIIQDIERLRENVLLVVDANGAIVDGVADRNGHRKGQGPGRQYQQRRPPQTAKKLADLNLHEDAKKALLLIDSQQRPIWLAKNQNNQSE